MPAPGACPRADGSRCIDGDKLMTELMNSTEFLGATNYVKFFEGINGFGAYGRGDREEGHTYTLWQFNADAYDKFPENGGFAFLGSWYTAADQGTTTWCTDEPEGLQDYHGPSLYDVNSDGLMGLKTFACNKPVYNSPTGAMVPDTPPAIVIYIASGGIAFLWFWAAITLFCALASLFIVVEYGFTKLIKASQKEMMWAMILGAVCGAARIASAAAPMSDASCTARIWFGHLNFFLIFTSLSVKTYRIHR